MGSRQFPVPSWVQWEAVDPDGARNYFSHEPEPTQIAGVYANDSGTNYEFDDPVWVWEPSDEDGVYQFAGHEQPPVDWRTTKRRLDGGQIRLELEVAA